MKSSKACLMIAFTLIIAACSSDKPTQLGISQPSASPVPAASATPAESPATLAPVPAKFRRTLVGLIDGKHAVVMELSRTKSDAEDSSELYGTYRYKKVQKKSLSLSGKIAKDGTVELTETADDKETGIFIGKLVLEIRGDDSRLKFTGNWKKSKSDPKALPFELAETRFDLGGLRLVSKEQTEENKKQKQTIDIQYPQLVGADAAKTDVFNKAMNEFVAKQTNAFRKNVKEMMADRTDAGDWPGNDLDISYTTTYADKNVISVLVWTYQYTGGAHGGSSSTTFNYDLQNGRLLKLADLFQPNSGYLKVIANYCTAALIKDIGQEADQEWLRNGAAPKADNYKSWCLTDDGLQITFDAYQVAAYAFGPQEVIVPYSALKEIIKPDSPLAAFTK